jgi:putative ABC transport system permease protein
MDALIQDLRYALRTLARSPGFTLVAVLTLALGIGATTTIFSVVEGVLLRSLPFPDAGRLVDIKQLQERSRRPGVQGGATSPLSAYLRWSTADHAFDATAVYRGGSPVLRGRGPAERVTSWSVSAGFFPLLGARPLLGRGFTADEDRAGSAPVAVLSHGFWVDRLGADPRVLGRTVTLDTTAYTVVGVMPEGFRYPAGAQVWTNLGWLLSGPRAAERAREFGFWAVARLRPGVTAAQAQRQLDVINRRAWSTDPDARPWLPVVTPLRDYLTGPVRGPLQIMLGAVVLVLLIACANVASLVLSRALGRQHQVAMRAALGAGRGRLVQASLAEALVVAGAGGALGLLAATWLVPLVVKLAGAELARVGEISLDGRVLAACLGVSVLAGLVTGVLPAWHAARLPPGEVLKAGGRDRAVTSRGRLGGALIVGQLALTTVLLAGAGLLGRTFLHLTRSDPGFDPKHLLVADVQLPAARYARGAQDVAYVRRARERLAAVPGVTATAAGSGIPLFPGAINVVTRPGTEGERAVEVFISAVTPDYFRVLGIPLLRGRGLEALDPDAVLIDAAAAQEFFPGEDPVGKRFTYFGTVTRTVVGVVGDVRQEMLPIPAPMHVYEPYAERPSGYLKVLVVTTGDPARSVAAVRRGLQELDPDVPVDRVAPMTSLMAESIARQTLYALLLGSFAVMALVLSAVGVYGLVSYGVSERTREFGIRIALGADRGRVLRLVVGRALVLGGLGSLLGLAGALAASRTLRGLLYGVKPSDPAALLGAGLLLFAVTVAASWLPARRATKVDPVVALRSE